MFSGRPEILVAAGHVVGCWDCVAVALAEEALPTIRASSLAIFVGKDWSVWLEELEEKCINISSDIFEVLNFSLPFPMQMNYLQWVSSHVIQKDYENPRKT